MGKIPTRGGTTRGGSIRGGKARGSASGRGSLTSKSTITARGGGASPIRNTVATRVVPTNRGKGRDPLYRNKDSNIEKNVPKESEKKVYKVRLTNVVVKKLISAKLKGAHIKVKASGKMEIEAGEGGKIQLNVSSPKKAEMIFIRNDNNIELVGNVIGFASNTTESHAAAKRELIAKKKLKESYEKEIKGKRKVQVLEMTELPSEQEVKTKSKRQKNNSGTSIKVQQSPPITFVQVPSSKVVSQHSNAVRGGKPLRGKARGGRARTTVATEVVDVDDVIEAAAATATTTTTTNSARGSNTTRSGKTTGGGKFTRSRGAKTIISEAPKVSSLNAQPTRGKRGRPAGVTSRTMRGAKTYTSTTTRISTVPKTSAIIKNDNEQQSMSEGNTSSSSKKGKGKVNEQLAPSSEWKPGQTITILTEFKQARKICEDMENDIQGVIEDLGAFENFYNTCVNSIKNINNKGNTHDYLLRDIEKQFGEGSPANKLMQRYLQLEKDIKIIHDELWRAANEGPIYED